jgi:predicted acetyltransferase
LDIRPGQDGRFGYQKLPLYWTDPNRQPFLIYVDDELAGFVLLQKGSQISDDKDVWDMAEFFVVRSYRRKGVGMKAAWEIWEQFPGKWEVRVSDKNPMAKLFWERAIVAFLNKTIEAGRFKKSDDIWHVFSFDSSIR